ncbi:hypothetical protein TWF730_005215 [Orbilia blumenaviensis]|uniref:Uncharacterized protein n=1 Tax=Orbilia blumenaviensis TaxID=1796055 RepID=A0AAV9VJX5_9PEZI
MAAPGGGYKEPVSTQLARALPDLPRFDQTRVPSTSRYILSGSYITEWLGFSKNVRDYIKNLNDGTKSVTGDSMEDILVPHVVTDQEDLIRTPNGIRQRIEEQLVEPIERILAASSPAVLPVELAAISFGDLDAAGLKFFIPNESEIVTIQTGTAGEGRNIRAVVEFRPPWVCELRNWPVASGTDQRNEMGRRLGQLCKYMNAFHLQYGMFTTYNSTIFLERSGLAEFKFSPVLQQSSANPSTREALLYFLNKVSKSQGFGGFIEPSSLAVLPASKPRTRQQGKCLVNGHYKSIECMPQSMVVRGESCVITSREGVLLGVFDPMSALNPRVYKGLFTDCRNARPTLAIMKIFKEDQEERFLSESISSEEMSSSKYLPDFMASGRTSGGYNTPGGLVVVKTFRPGSPLSDSVWDCLHRSTTYQEIFMSMKMALQDFRNRYLILNDLTRDDILWDSERQMLTIVDLESCSWQPEDRGPQSIVYEMAYLTGDYSLLSHANI